MAIGFLDSCDRFCREHPCRIAGGIISAGVLVALFVLGQGVQIDRMARATEIQARGTAGALDEHITQERENNKEVMEVLGEIQTDLSVVKYRLDLNRGASLPGPELMASPEHIVSQ